MLTIEITAAILESSKYRNVEPGYYGVFLIRPGCDGPGSLLTEQGDPDGDDGFD